MDPSVILAAGSALAGLFGGGGSTPVQKPYQFGRLRKKALKAGFNPLTALKYAGGGAGSSSFGAPELTLPERLSSAMADLSGALSDIKDRKAKEAYDALRMQQMRVEIDQVQKANNRKLRPVDQGYSVPNAITTTKQTHQKPMVVKPKSRLSFPSHIGDTQILLNGSPFEKAPVLVGRDDGLTGANPDAPPTPEEDLWGWARDGTLAPNLWEMYKRNTMTDAQRKRVDRLKSGVSSGFSRALDWANSVPDAEPPALDPFWYMRRKK